MQLNSFLSSLNDLIFLTIFFLLFRPKEKDSAFFDVEGIVAKDTLLFRYEDGKSLLW